MSFQHYILKEQYPQYFYLQYFKVFLDFPIIPFGNDTSSGIFAPEGTRYHKRLLQYF